MSKCIEKLQKISKRGIALGLAAALALSMLTVSTHADAAKQPKPALNTKRKTMYYDVFSRKTYNLKIKNLKADQIISTTWKTSNKKAVAISKKKDKSVLLTAKKKGKATITATVKYIPKGTFKISKKRLTCKVTSKSDGVSNKTTPQPTGVVSPVPTFTVQPIPTNTPLPDATETPAPTETPGIFEVQLDKSELKLCLGLKDTAQLTALIKPESTTNPSIEWSSSNENVVTVQGGLVTAVGVGEAIITAGIENGEPAKCTVTVGKPEEKNIPDSSNELSFTYKKDGVEVPAAVNLKALDSYLGEEGSAWDALDTLINELADKGGFHKIERYPDVDGDGKRDKLVIEKKADNEALLRIIVEGEETKLDVTFLTPDEEADLGKVSATVTTESGKRYVITVQSDNHNKIYVENDDREIMTVEKTGAGYTILVSEGFGITLGTVESVE